MVPEAVGVGDCEDFLGTVVFEDVAVSGLLSHDFGFFRVERNCFEVATIGFVEGVGAEFVGVDFCSTKESSVFKNTCIFEFFV